jgi:hypothetical protein
MVGVLGIIKVRKRAGNAEWRKKQPKKAVVARMSSNTLN